MTNENNETFASEAMLVDYDPEHESAKNKLKNFEQNGKKTKLSLYELK